MLSKKSAEIANELLKVVAEGKLLIEGLVRAAWASTLTPRY
jgi:hypothetical protein